MSVLSIRDLHKQFGPIRAVDGLSLEVEAGQVFGLLGPNGSGKTTTLAIVLGISRANSGSFTWFEGHYGQQHRRHIGALLETPNFYPYLNADDNLRIVAAIKRVPEPRLDELLELVNLRERRRSPFSTYSLGMKQRLAIAATLIGNPEVLIFDEPTNGLDPQGIAEVRNIIQEIAGRGKTIFMASHILDEVEKICSHVAIIKRGKLLATGAVGAILSDEAEIELAAANLDVLEAWLRSVPGILQVDRRQNRLVISAQAGLNTEDLNRAAHLKGLVLTHLIHRQRSLEAEFLEITGKQ
jgi:ABC-type multidrug transport system ATPase subunit